MNRIDKVDIKDEIAGLVAVMVFNEATRLKVSLDDIDITDISIKTNVIGSRIIYTVTGKLGNDINNPDLNLDFNDRFNEDSLPDNQELLGQVLKYIVILKMIKLANKV
jgi:hypothetical protein